MSRTLFRHTSKLVAAAVFALGAHQVSAQDKVTFLTSWYAQAEHGGFYQALATGLYKKAGLDVTVKMGGPQVNGMQILGAGQTDFLMSYDFSVLKAIEQGLPVTTVATSFQFDLQGLMTHEDVSSLSSRSRARRSWSPPPAARTGGPGCRRSSAMAKNRPGLHLQPAAIPRRQEHGRNRPTCRQSRMPRRRQGAKVKFFLFADDGYPPYGTTIVTMQRMVNEKPDMVRRFVRASMEGWKSYLNGDPAAANALIKKDNPNMKDEQIAFAIGKLR